jgi:hypothetical protein
VVRRRLRARIVPLAEALQELLQPGKNARHFLQRFLTIALMSVFLRKARRQLCVQVSSSLGANVSKAQKSF